MSPPDIHPAPFADAAGVSTIELLIVAAVAGTLLASVAGHLSGGRARLAVQQAAASFRTDVHHARSLAVSRNDTVRLSFASATDGDCWIVHTGARTDCQCLPGGRASCTGGSQALKVAHWPQWQPVRVSSNVRSLAFDPTLGTVTPTGTVRFSAAGSATLHQVVSVLGRVRTCSPPPVMAGQTPC